MPNHTIATALCLCSFFSAFAAPSFAQSVAHDMAQQEHGLTRWMQGIETVGLTCSVSGHAAEFIKTDHLSTVVTPKLKNLGLEVISSRQATKENKPFLAVKVSTMPCSGSVEWEVQIRVYDRALRTDKRAAAEVIVWEYVVEHVTPGHLHDASPIDSALTAGLNYFSEAISKKPGNLPIK
jgi:hypothetical protein